MGTGHWLYIPIVAVACFAYGYILGAGAMRRKFESHGNKESQ